MVASVAQGPGGPYIVHAATSLVPFEQQLSLLITVLVLSGPIALFWEWRGDIRWRGGFSRRSTASWRSPTASRPPICTSAWKSSIPNDELGRLARTFNALIDRLQNAIEEMRRFTADAAHELRIRWPSCDRESTSPCGCRGRPSNTGRRSRRPPTKPNRLTRLADQLLFLTRQAAGMTQIDREETRLDALIKDVAEQFAGRVEEAGLSLRVGALAPWTVRGDDIRLSQVFYNVLENAIKYTPRGGRIEVRGQAVDHHIEIEVEDTGVGIPAGTFASRFQEILPRRAIAKWGTGRGGPRAVDRPVGPRGAWRNDFDQEHTGARNARRALDSWQVDRLGIGPLD